LLFGHKGTKKRAQYKTKIPFFVISFYNHSEELPNRDRGTAYSSPSNCLLLTLELPAPFIEKSFNFFLKNNCLNICVYGNYFVSL